MFGVNLFLSCMSMGIRALLLGDSYAVTIMITVMVSLLIIVGVPILIVFGIAKKNKVGPNDPLIQSKNYTQKEQETQKRKSYVVAKRSLFMSNLSYISLNQLVLSLVLFLVVYMGISAISYTSGKQNPNRISTDFGSFITAFSSPPVYRVGFVTFDKILSFNVIILL